MTVAVLPSAKGIGWIIVLVKYPFLISWLGEFLYALAENKSQAPTCNYSSVIKNPDPFEFSLPIFLIDDEIHPALGITLGLGPVQEVDAEHQNEEDKGKKDCFSSSKQIVIAPQKSEHHEHLEDLEPFGLQGV